MFYLHNKKFTTLKAAQKEAYLMLENGVRDTISITDDNDNPVIILTFHPHIEGRAVCLSFDAGRDVVSDIPIKRKTAAVQQKENLDTSALLPLRDAFLALPFPGYPARPCYQTILRWYTSGIQGVILETTLIGGRRYTSIDAIETFLARLQAARSNPAPSTSSTRARTRAEQRRDEQITQALDRFGI